jgi:hypothetical protein
VAFAVAGAVVVAPVGVTAVVVVLGGALLAVIPVLGWGLLDHLDAMQRAHLAQ